MKEPLFEEYSFWEDLRNDRPVILYGTGNGADKIIDSLESFGIEPDGIFASDGFVRDRTFRGKKVLSYSDTVSKYGEDITILLSFGTNRKDVLDFIFYLDKRHNLIIPDVPLYGGNLFDRKYFLSKEQTILETLDLFKEEKSRKLFADAINFRLTGKLRYLTNCEPFKESLMNLFKCTDVRIIVDGGAYDGDTVKTFLEVFPDAERVFAIEPDPHSFSKLGRISDDRIIPINSALSDKKGVSDFSSSSSRGSGISGIANKSRKILINTTTVDSLLSEDKCDLIKLDVEGTEREALIGSSFTISNYAPNLIVSLYHRTDDVFDIPRYVKSLSSDYDLFLRRPFCVPMWDMNLFAVRKRRI